MPSIVTDNDYGDGPPSLYNGNIAWHGYDGHDYEIHFWGGSTTTQVTDNEYNDESPSLYGNTVAWQGYDGNDWEIYYVTDSSLPVELSSFTAFATSDSVIIKWRTESETNNIGFNIYRSDAKDGDYTKVNAKLIQGAGTDATPYDYSFTDDNVVKGFTYYYYIEDVDFTGKTNKSHIIKVIVDKQGIRAHLIPRQFALLQNYPNPFNPETWLPYQLSNDSLVLMRIYDVKGQLIHILDLGKREAGYYVNKDKAAYWDGKNAIGQAVGSGVRPSSHGHQCPC